MKSRCVMVYKDEPDCNFINAQKRFKLSDYIVIANVEEARKLTDEIFLANKDFIDNYIYQGYKITWAWYDAMYHLCLKYLELKPLIDEIERIDPEVIELRGISSNYAKILRYYFFSKTVNLEQHKSALPEVKDFITNTILLSYTLLSHCFFCLTGKTYIATWTGDFVFGNTRSDFRLNHLYKKYHENDIKFVEFIRTRSLKEFFSNVFKRKRFSIHYFSIVYFVELLTPKTKYVKKPQNFFQSIMFDFHHGNVVLQRSVLILRIVLKQLRISKVVLISFSSRSAHLALAAKTLGIPTIGIMHGLQQKEYAVYEFMESYSEDKKIGCDLYGVWSPEYQHYFRRFSKIMHPESIQYSGLLRPKITKLAFQPFKRISSKKVRVLLISEPLVSATEIAPFIEKLQLYDDIEIAIKVRPMIKDSYYEELLQLLPSIRTLKVYDGKIEVDGAEFDIFLGSNSTAVIEASLLDKISILVMTQKWGDYFDLNNLIDGCSLVVEHPDMLYDHILERIENESELESISKIRRKFFGDNKDGAQWLVDQL